MKPYSYYGLNDRQYPEKERFATYILVDKNGIVANTLVDIGEVLGIPDFNGFDRVKEARRIAKTMGFALNKFYDEPLFNSFRNEYYKEQQKRANEFKQDLLEETGLTNHPNAELLYETAKKLCGKNGFSDLEYEKFSNIFIVLAGLLK